MLHLFAFVYSVAIGIDLGTINSCLRIYDEKTKSLVPIKINDMDTFPSAVAYDTTFQDNKPYHLALTGSKAFDHNVSYPNNSNLFTAVKRLIGLTANDFEKTEKLAEIKNKLIYDIQIDNSGINIVHKFKHQFLDKKEMRLLQPVDISSEVLQALYAEALKYSTDIETVVITVPAYFTENQVKATNKAAELAGLKMARTMNEPVAAAYAFQILHPGSKSDCYLVFDIGGGTLDISVLEHDDDVLEVKTYSGDNLLGGEDINNALLEDFNKILDKKKIILQNESDRVRVRNFIEEFKIKLCNLQNESPETTDVNFMAEYWHNENLSVKYSLSTSKFNEICSDVFARVRKQLTDSKVGIISKYEKAGGKKSNITKVLFVGGSSRIPYIRKMVGEIFGPSKLNYDLNADTCVAEGAAYYSASIAGYLNEKDTLYLVDVVPMHIGICVEEDKFESILDMNQTIPAKGSKIFTTAYDMQQKVSIQVAQGLRYSFKENNLLGRFDVTIKTPGPRGGPQIEVTVKMDKNRDVEVVAIDKATNEETAVKFTRADVSLSDEEIARIKKDKELNAHKDEELRNRYEKRSELEGFIAKIESEVKSMTDAYKKEKITRLVSEAKSWLQLNKDTFEIENLENTFNHLKENVERIIAEPSKESERVMDEKIREEL